MEPFPDNAVREVFPEIDIGKIQSADREQQADDLHCTAAAFAELPSGKALQSKKDCPDDKKQRRAFPPHFQEPVFPVNRIDSDPADKIDTGQQPSAENCEQSQKNKKWRCAFHPRNIEWRTDQLPVI
jgi:hypothetical protein